LTIRWVCLCSSELSSMFSVTHLATPHLPSQGSSGHDLQSNFMSNSLIMISIPILNVNFANSLISSYTYGY
jgi:hypothetical protein